MASTSCSEIAESLLAQCLAGGAPDLAVLHRLLDLDCSEALFRIVVEGLADRFEPRLCDRYADLFSEAIGRLFPEFVPAELRARYERVRRVRRCDRNPLRVFVLSRVTLGADIAVSSVVLDAAKRRFPDAAIVLVGSAKAAEMFTGDPRISHLPVVYPRAGSLRERLGSWKALDLRDPQSIVIDPDSRLTQLGLLPVCDDENYFFFESRAFGGDSSADLTSLARDWTGLTFGVRGEPFLALGPPPPRKPGQVAVSLGVGENPAKRIGGQFEPELLRFLSSFAGTVIVDQGSGGEEADRVRRAAAGLPNVQIWQGSFASFASIVAESELYVGYDSAGQHAAAALGTPLVAVFAGFVSERMFERWKPTGPAPIRIVKASGPEQTLVRATEAIRTISA